MVPRIIGQNARLRSALRRPHVANADLGVVACRLVGIWLTLFMNSAMPNRPSASADDLDAVEQLGEAEGEARRAGLDVGADDADRQAEHRHGDALERRAARQRRAREQAQQHQRADFGRAELQRHLHQHRRQENHLGDAQRRADEGGDHGDAERGAALALFGQRKAVETGHRVRWMTRQVEQDRADRAAILRAVDRRRTASGSRPPASCRRSAAAGSRWWRRGPMPGSTPTMLPTSTPTKHHIRLCGSSATPKPYQRSVRAVPDHQKPHAGAGMETFSR